MVVVVTLFQDRTEEKHRIVWLYEQRLNSLIPPYLLIHQSNLVLKLINKLTKDNHYKLNSTGIK